MICIHTKTNITKEEKAQELQNTINCKKEMFVKLVKQTEILCEQINQNESYLKCIKQVLFCISGVKANFFGMSFR